MKKLEARIAHDKVRFLEVQSLNGSLFGNHLVLAGGAVLLLSLCVCLLKKPNQKDGLSAPLKNRSGPMTLRLALKIGASEH